MSGRPGYYPESDILAQADAWDSATRELIIRRVRDVPPIRFFSPSELPTITAILERLVPQADRAPKFRIPIPALIDERLYAGRSEGTLYAGMPVDGVAYRRGIAAMDKMAWELHQAAFHEIPAIKQERILLSVRSGEPAAARNEWEGLPPRQFWTLVLNDALGAYYSHPFAWDEIGFGGPAYPRGYMRLEQGRADPSEAEEKKYLWAPPEPTLSDESGELK